MESVAAFPWNQWPPSRGISGRLPVESVAAFTWNRWPSSRGIGGRNALEYAQALSNRLNLSIRLAHYPPYCSKYNPIEHRVFPHVTRACQGVPLETLETAQYYMAKAATSTGLNILVRIIDKVFQTGRKYAADFKETMTIQFDDFLPKWNYTVIPQTG